MQIRTSTDIDYRKSKAVKKYTGSRTLLTLALCNLPLQQGSEPALNPLDITNIFLAAAVGFLILIVVRHSLAEFLGRKKESRITHDVDQKLKNLLSEVGLTMQDGGEKVDPSHQRREEDSDDAQDIPPG